MRHSLSTTAPIYGNPARPVVIHFEHQPGHAPGQRDLEDERATVEIIALDFQHAGEWVRIEGHELPETVLDCVERIAWDHVEEE